jgi:hypothetical protein
VSVTTTPGDALTGLRVVELRAAARRVGGLAQVLQVITR